MWSGGFLIDYTLDAILNESPNAVVRMNAVESVGAAPRITNVRWRRYQRHRPNYLGSCRHRLVPAAWSSEPPTSVGLACRPVGAWRRHLMKHIQVTTAYRQTSGSQCVADRPARAIRPSAMSCLGEFYGTVPNLMPASLFGDRRSRSANGGYWPSQGLSTGRAAWMTARAWCRVTQAFPTLRRTGPPAYDISVQQTALVGIV